MEDQYTNLRTPLDVDAGQCVPPFTVDQNPSWVCRLFETESLREDLHLRPGRSLRHIGPRPASVRPLENIGLSSVKRVFSSPSGPPRLYRHSY
jgi:hypothetical protein